MYEKQKALSNECSFFTLPVVDGYLWRNPQQIAGLRLEANVGGKVISLEGGIPVVSSPVSGRLHILWPLKDGYGTLVMYLDECGIKMNLIGGKSVDWFWNLTVADNTKLPFTKISHTQIACKFDGMDYFINTPMGFFSKSPDGGIFKIIPKENKLVLDLAER